MIVKDDFSDFIGSPDALSNIVDVSDAPVDIDTQALEAARSKVAGNNVLDFSNHMVFFEEHLLRGQGAYVFRDVAGIPGPCKENQKDKPSELAHH